MPKKRATTASQRNPERTKVKQASSATGPSTKRHLEFVNGTSAKFWEIELSGTTQTVRFGRIGKDGQIKTTKFADAAKAQALCVTLIGQKVKKGYIESIVPGKSSSKKRLPKKAKKEEAKTVTKPLASNLPPIHLR